MASQQEYAVGNTKETVQKAKEAAAKDYTADKSKEGNKESDVGKLSELKDKAMDLFSGQKESDFAKETIYLKEQGFEARGANLDATTQPQGESGGRGEDVIATVAKLDPVRDTAEAFRKSDQMSGQSFNDVGGTDDDAQGTGGGVYRVHLKHVNKNK